MPLEHVLRYYSVDVPFLGQHFVLFTASATASVGVAVSSPRPVELNHGQSVADVMVHVGNFPQPFFRDLLFLPFPQSALDVQSSGNNAGNRVREAQDSEFVIAAAEQQHLKHKTNDCHKTRRNQEVR